LHAILDTYKQLQEEKKIPDELKLTEARFMIEKQFVNMQIKDFVHYYTSYENG